MAVGVQDDMAVSQEDMVDLATDMAILEVMVDLATDMAILEALVAVNRPIGVVVL